LSNSARLAIFSINDVTPNNVVTELNNFAPQNTTSIKYKAGDQEYDIIIKDKRHMILASGFPRDELTDE